MMLTRKPWELSFAVRIRCFVRDVVDLALDITLSAVILYVASCYFAATRRTIQLTDTDAVVIAGTLHAVMYRRRPAS